MSAVPIVDVDALAASVAGRVVLPGDHDYDLVRAGFNGMIDRRPAAIVCIAGDQDAAAAIAFAREHDLPLAIRSGGHSAPGHGCCDDGIVIDCRELTSTRSTPDSRSSAADPGSPGSSSTPRPRRTAWR